MAPLPWPLSCSPFCACPTQISVLGRVSQWSFFPGHRIAGGYLETGTVYFLCESKKSFVCFLKTKCQMFVYFSRFLFFFLKRECKVHLINVDFTGIQWISYGRKFIKDKWKFECWHGNICCIAFKSWGELHNISNLCCQKIE